MSLVFWEFTQHCNQNRMNEERRSSIEVGVNKMSVQLVHNTISSGYGINGVGLLAPLRVDTIVTIVTK